jgi:hypothetical protein
MTPMTCNTENATTTPEKVPEKKMPDSIDGWIKTLQPEQRKFFCIFSDPRLRPPILEEMWEDIKSVISNIASRYTDTGCVELHYDELCNKGLHKLAKLVHDGILHRLPNRREFFAFFRTAVNNHIQGQVQRHRLTQKRTGIKPPPKTASGWPAPNAGPTKPIEISLNDEDAHLQVGDMQAKDDDINTLTAMDMEVILTPIEFLVYKQMVETNDAAKLLAEIDGYRGLSAAEGNKLVLHAQHKAEGLGLGMALELYRQLEEQVMVKFRKYWDMKEIEDSEFNQALAYLEAVFVVKAPRFFDPIVYRRLFTILAAKHYQKVLENPTTVEMLKKVGAKIPNVTSSVMVCRGVLYDKNDRTCNACQISTACQAEAANYGLGAVTISPKLLHPKHIRVARLAAEPPVAGPAVVTRSRPQVVTVPDAAEPKVQVVVDHTYDARGREIMIYLRENFKVIHIDREHRKEVAFCHKEKPPSASNGAKIILSVVDKGDGQFHLRFSVPAEELQPKLDQRRKGVFYLPDASTGKDAVGLINLHAKLSFC